MCTVLLSPGGYPIAVNKYIISYTVARVFGLVTFNVSPSSVFWINKAEPRWSTFHISVHCRLFAVNGAKLFARIDIQRWHYFCVDTVHCSTLTSAKTCSVFVWSAFEVSCVLFQPPLDSDIIYIYIYIYVGFKTFFYVVRHLDSIASYLTAGLHLGFFRSWPSLYLPYSFSSVFLVLSFVSSSTSMLFRVIFLLPFSEHGRTM